MKNEIPKDQRFFRASEHTLEITNYIKVYSDELYHYGVKRRSGRYPWGSGDRPYQALGYRAQSKEMRKTMTKEEKYRAQSVDEADRKYGSMADRYEKRFNKYNDKFVNKYRKSQDTVVGFVDVNNDGEGTTRVTVDAGALEKADKLHNKAAKYADKASAALLGKDMCDALLQEDLAKISVMDAAADKKARGKAEAKQLLAMIGTTLAINAVAIPAAGFAMVPLGARTNYNRLSDDDINRAYNKVIDESGLTSLSKRQERSIREAIGSTTGKNARRISLNRQSTQNNLHEPSDEEKKKLHHH